MSMGRDGLEQCMYEEICNTAHSRQNWPQLINQGASSSLSQAPGYFVACDKCIVPAPAKATEPCEE